MAVRLECGSAPDALNNSPLCRTIKISSYLSEKVGIRQRKDDMSERKGWGGVGWGVDISCYDQSGN